MNNRTSLTVLGLFFSVLMLLPFSRFAELPILILSIYGMVAFFSKKLVFNSARFKVLTTVYLSYLLMILISSLDSYWLQKSWLVGLASFRFYLAACALLAFVKLEHFRLLINLITYFTLFIAFDAMVQYFVGFDIIGRESYPDRLNGIFGQHHAKLGPFIALLLPVVLIGLQDKKPVIRWVAVFAIIISVILSGTRSAWIMMVFTIIAYFFYHVKQMNYPNTIH